MRTEAWLYSPWQAWLGRKGLEDIVRTTMSLSS